MKKINRYFLTLFFAALIFPTIAQEIPSVKGFTIGQQVPLGNCPENTKFVKNKLYGAIKLMVCVLPDKTYAGIPVYSITADIYKNKIFSLSVDFKNKGVMTKSVVESALKKKYGPKTKGLSVWLFPNNDIIFVDNDVLVMSNVDNVENSANGDLKERSKDL